MIQPNFDSFVLLTLRSVVTPVRSCYSEPRPDCSAGMLEVGVLYSNHFLYLTLLLRNVYLHFHIYTVMIPKVRKNCTSYDSLIVDPAFACLLITSER